MVKGAPTNPITGALPRQRADYLLNCLAHVAQIVGVAGRERIDVVGRTHGVADHRAFAFLIAQLEAHGLHRQQQVGEDDGGIHVEHFDRLQRDGRGQIGALADFENAVALADLAVFLHVAAGLPHEPNRAHVGGPAAASV